MYKVTTGYEFNNLHWGKEFVKLTNETENHNGFQFQTGLNIDTKEFKPNGHCSAGGIYFCSKKNMLKWIKYSKTVCVNYRSVLIPDDAKIYTEKGKFKTDKIILSEKKHIWSDNKLCKKIVNYNPKLFKYCINQTDKLCKLAITKNAYTFRHVKDKTYEMSKFAVSKDGRAIQFIDNQTDELCKMAVTQNLLSLVYIKNQTDELCKYAISLDPVIISAVKNQTYELCKFALEKSPYVLEYIENQTDEICKFAVQNEPRTLWYVRNQTLEICKLAVANNSNTFKQIKCPIIYLQILYPCFERIMPKFINRFL
jgi:hypothetical protein